MYKKLLIISLAILVTGCDQKHKRMDIARPWKTEVKQTSYHDDIVFGSGSSRITSGEISKLKGLVMQTKPNEPKYARLLAPQVKNRSLQEKRVGTVSRCLVKMGVNEKNIEVIYLDQPSEGTGERSVTVILDQFAAIPPQCPGWDQIMDGKIPPEGEMNFGCANEVNLAKMVANPRDLMKGQTTDHGDGTYNAAAIQRYRTDKIKELKVEVLDRK